MSTRPKNWHHKLKPKATNVTCVNTWRSGRDHHIRDLRRHLVRPFRPHAIHEQDIRNVHDVRSRAACLSQELAAEIPRGAWARIRLISSTQTSSAKKKIFCVPILTSEWRSDSALALPHSCGRPKRSQITFRRSFPLNFHTSKREIVENGCRPQSSSRSRTSQSNTWCVWQHSMRLPQKLALPFVNVRFVQEHVATTHTVVTCLKLKFRDHFTRALHYLCDDVSS